jgi:Regulator of ribonuclease activity B
MDDVPEWYERTLSEQREMTIQTWDALRDRGVHEESVLRLEFFFDAPDGAAAESLATYLSTETGYELSITRDEVEAEAGLGWLVGGRTGPTRVSLEILDQWVIWMVGAGAEHGACVFAGWGTSIPSGIPVQ